MIVVAAVAAYCGYMLWFADRTRSIVLIIAGLLCFAVGSQRLRG